MVLSFRSVPCSARPTHRPASFQAWYADRPEVLKWQREATQQAKDTGYARTLMGR